MVLIPPATGILSRGRLNFFHLIGQLRKLTAKKTQQMKPANAVCTSTSGSSNVISNYQNSSQSNKSINPSVSIIIIIKQSMSIQNRSDQIGKNKRNYHKP